jgi:hypothetical protein
MVAQDTGERLAVECWQLSGESQQSHMGGGRERKISGGRLWVEVDDGFGIDPKEVHRLDWDDWGAWALWNPSNRMGCECGLFRLAWARTQERWPGPGLQVTWAPQKKE